MKYFIISQPKAGTYLASNILKNLGIESSGLHFDPGLVRRFRKLGDHDKLGGSVRSGIKKELRGNQFAVGHLACNSENIDILKPVVKILITRNRDGIRKSAERYLKETGLDVLSIITDENLDNIERWKDDPEVFHITFEEIINKDIKKIDDLQIFLFGKVTHDSATVLDRALSEDSLTKSSIR